MKIDKRDSRYTWLVLLITLMGYALPFNAFVPRLLILILMAVYALRIGYYGYTSFKWGLK